MTMTTEEFRLECLRFASICGGDETQVVERARAYAAFVLGDAEIVGAARVLADKVRDAEAELRQAS